MRRLRKFLQGSVQLSTWELRTGLFCRSLSSMRSDYFLLVIILATKSGTPWLTSSVDLYDALCFCA